MTRSRWMTVADVCEELRIHRVTWYRWQDDESKPKISRVPNLGKLVRYKREDFNAYCEAIETTISEQPEHQKT